MLCINIYLDSVRYTFNFFEIYIAHELLDFVATFHLNILDKHQLLLLYRYLYSLQVEYLQALWKATCIRVIMSIEGTFCYKHIIAI